MKAGLEVNKSDLKKIVKILQTLPRNVQRNASVSALNAGARVVRDKARTKAPECIRRSIRNVRLKQEDGDPVVAITAGDGSRPNQGWFGAFNKASKDVLGQEKPPCVAVWIELGTYGDRDLGRDPYSPRTLKKKSYASGRSDSKFWGFPTRWIAPTPFMRPALIEAAGDGSVERAMAKQFDKYFKKLGVR